MRKRVFAVSAFIALLLITGGPLATAADEAQTTEKPRVVKPETEVKKKLQATEKKPAATSKREQASAVGFGPNGGAQGPSEEPWQEQRPNPVDSKGVTEAAGAKNAAQAIDPLRDPVRGPNKSPAGN
ncbi:MAG: hypothetical protein WHT06_14175 [Desulfobacterales bacterium]